MELPSGLHVVFCNHIWLKYVLQWKSYRVLMHCSITHYHILCWSLNKTLPKAQRTRGLSSAYKSNFFRSYHKFKHKSWSNFIFRILTKHQFQNLDQTSASRLNLTFKILTKPNFIFLTKVQLHNLYKTSTAKYWLNSSSISCLNFNIKILTKTCAQSLNKGLALWPNLSFQICNKLLPTQSTSSTSTSATVTTSTRFDLATSHARVTSIKSTKRQLLS